MRTVIVSSQVKQFMCFEGWSWIYMALFLPSLQLVLKLCTCTHGTTTLSVGAVKAENTSLQVVSLSQGTVRRHTSYSLPSPGGGFKVSSQHKMWVLDYGGKLGNPQKTHIENGRTYNYTQLVDSDFYSALFCNRPLMFLLLCESFWIKWLNVKGNV